MRLVTAGPVSAVVADCDVKTPLTARALRAHDAVVRRIARVAPAILPARFGTIVESESSVVGLIERWSADLCEALALVEGREQMTLRLFARGRHDSRVGRFRRAGQDAVGKTSRTPSIQARAISCAVPTSRQRAAAPELERLRDVLGPHRDGRADREARSRSADSDGVSISFREVGRRPTGGCCGVMPPNRAAASSRADRGRPTGLSRS